MKKTTIAKRLNKAADYIENVGWFEGDLVDPGTGCACALGAIGISNHGKKFVKNPSYEVLYDDQVVIAFAEYLDATQGGVAITTAPYRGRYMAAVYEFNDTEAGSADAVISALRAAAAELVPA